MTLARDKYNIPGLYTAFVIYSPKIECKRAVHRMYYVTYKFNF